MNTQFISVGTVGTQEVGFHLLTMGKKGGMRICLVCSIHGDEHTPHYLLSRILPIAHTLPIELSIIPDANPLALAVRQRTTPHDGIDLNRVFPGNPNGTITEQVAAALFAAVSPHDLVLELHTFESLAMGMIGILPTLDGVVNPSVLHALAACNVDYIWKPEIQRQEEQKYTGALSVALVRAGVSAGVLEFPSSRILSEQQLERYAEQVLSYLKQPDTQPSIIPQIVTRHEVKAPRAGIFLPAAVVGSTIEEGTLLGSLVALPSYTAHEVRAEHQGILIQMGQRTFINKGDVISAVGIPMSSAERLK